MALVDQIEIQARLMYNRCIFKMFKTLNHHSGFILFLLHFGQYVLYRYTLSMDERKVKTGAAVVREVTNDLLFSYLVKVRNSLAHFNKLQLLSNLDVVTAELLTLDLESVVDPDIRHGLEVLKNSDFNIMYDFLASIE